MDDGFYEDDFFYFAESYFDKMMEENKEKITVSPTTPCDKIKHVTIEHDDFFNIITEALEYGFNSGYSKRKEHEEEKI